MTDDQPNATGTVAVAGTYSAAELEAALADPELLARTLAWAGLTVTRLDAERLRVAATDLTAVVRARVDEQRYELTFDEGTPEDAVSRASVSLALRFEPRDSDSSATQWAAALDPLPADASPQARRWLPKVLLALPQQLAADSATPSEPMTNGRWIWIVAFLVLLLALGLAV